jgi:acyl-CoA synthetase (NDP forming)
VNAVAALFHPRSVAVIGASRARGTIGGEILHNLLTYGFPGPVVPVNPAAATVQDVPAYPTVEDIPGPVDLAVIVVPAARVLEVARECGAKGVRSLVVISAGFAETGPEGRARQHELLRACREAGIRLIGPNCMGIVNTDPAVRLNATFAPAPPPEGRLGFLSQSGALGLAIMDHARTLGLGLSTFVSVGNKADLSTHDLPR